MCLNVGVSFLAAIWQTSTVAARHPVRLHVGAGDGKVTGALGQRVQRGLWLESRWGSRGSLGVTHHRWWCLETFPYKSMAWLNHYYYRTNLWTQYKLEEMQPLNVTKCQIGCIDCISLNWILNELWIICPDYCPRLTQRGTAALLIRTTSKEALPVLLQETTAASAAMLTHMS